MTESIDSNKKTVTKELDSEQVTIKKTKPPKPEEKPFKLFINEDLIPNLNKELIRFGVDNYKLELIEGERPVVGGKCWMMTGTSTNGRRFWLCFNTDDITSLKTFALAEKSVKASLLESFLIDEKKTTLALITSRLLQRLNGQKWLGAN